MFPNFKNISKCRRGSDAPPTPLVYEEDDDLTEEEQLYLKEWRENDMPHLRDVRIDGVGSLRDWDTVHG